MFLESECYARKEHLPQTLRARSPQRFVGVFSVIFVLSPHLRCTGLAVPHRSFRWGVGRCVVKKPLRNSLLETLSIQIDETKKSAQVAEITETDYFQTLQKEAARFRARPRGPDTP